jgi:hypothetical protein
MRMISLLYFTVLAVLKLLAAEGALLWDFPGNAAIVPSKVYLDEDF